ncbi:hypothetical protein NSK_003454 [Nannochloropsis salina CCMP1776]|uniref:Adenosylmethionine decarboxylase n=1 Tax=Nannochloropsis salina CCMP1776 TaxID=1027361 RepID=A0A4D9D0W6_9STRA|nr:hypothetical protein NSK_003454 [Nannochloropsis salina CCMP1776]|eukprot:TFJ85030.1 hypothetical protein NSK_003454 [Nannochloropsis salina CCMP1776]
MTLALVRAAVREAGVREVHSHVVVLGDDGLSPPGFTGICLIDESHVSAHCYSEKGWLALDVFTCGPTDPAEIADKLHQRLTDAVPGLRLVRRMAHDRFLHLDMAQGGSEEREQTRVNVDRQLDGFDEALFGANDGLGRRRDKRRGVEEKKERGVAAGKQMEKELVVEGRERSEGGRANVKKFTTCDRPCV